MPKHRSHGNLIMNQIKDQPMNRSADSYSTTSSTSSMSSSAFHSDSPLATPPDANKVEDVKFYFPGILLLSVWFCNVLFIFKTLENF